MLPTTSRIVIRRWHLERTFRQALGARAIAAGLCRGRVGADDPAAPGPRFALRIAKHNNTHFDLVSLDNLETVTGDHPDLVGGSSEPSRASPPSRSSRCASASDSASSSAHDLAICIRGSREHQPRRTS